MKKYLDIISDLGEGFGSYSIADDSSLLALVSSANIACGFHAGDPRTMASAVEKSIENNVGVGAHPGFPDLVGFGRRAMDLSSWEVTTDILYQIGALHAFVKAYGGELQHVTPHGKLGNFSVVDQRYAKAIAEGIAMFDPSLIVVTMPGELAEAAKKKGLRVAYTIFADRTYNDDGTLVARSNPHAVIRDPDTVVERVIRMVNEGKVTSITGKEIEVNGHSLLLHGDTPGSLQLAKQIKNALMSAEIEIRRLGDWIN
ncbi:LamB/YcsF family protein [Sporolactobacillus pectinivorans]|uniref:LamB/YcsF family protein n=1 Tax=Sporolactobacillus pectinivorans TaxID=1591408 RepID=UPI000C260D5A|nr:5-oxoprolinase subunit PxpA [Sporolactobacillus pectinivorans]